MSNEKWFVVIDIMLDVKAIFRSSNWEFQWHCFYATSETCKILEKLDIGDSHSTVSLMNHNKRWKSNCFFKVLGDLWNIRQMGKIKCLCYLNTGRYEEYTKKTCHIERSQPLCRLAKALLNLIWFPQFKKREKHSWRNITLFRGCFSRF